MINYTLIGTRIRNARVKKNITQEKLAEKLNVSAEYCSRIETGKAKINLERLSQLSDILDEKLEYLITGVVYESNSYLNEEIKTALGKCSGDKMDVIVKIIDMISKL